MTKIKRSSHARSGPCCTSFSTTQLPHHTVYIALCSNVSDNRGAAELEAQLSDDISKIQQRLLAIDVALRSIEKSTIQAAGVRVCVCAGVRLCVHA